MDGITVDNLSIEITSTSKSAADAVADLADSLSNLKKAIGRKPIRNPFSQEFLEASEKAGKLSSRLSRVANAMLRLKEAKGANISAVLPQRLTDLSGAVNSISTESLDKLDRLTTSLQKLSGVDLKGLPGALRYTAKQGATTAKPKVSAKVSHESAFARISNFFKQKFKLNVDSEDVKKAEHHTSKLKKIFDAMKRIVFYRAIRSAIRAITSAIKTGIQDLYQYSKVVNTTFAPAMDSIATNALYIKNSLGAMIGPLIESLAPVFERLADAFANIIDKIAQFFAALNGKTTYSKAIKYAVEYAEATDAAAKATKDFTIGLDELNVLNADSGKSGKSALDYSKMFEEAEIEKPIADFANKVKPAVDWIKDHLDQILNVALAIGAALLAWKITKTFISGISDVVGLFSKIGSLFSVSAGKVALFAGGLVLVGIGLYLLIDGLKEAAKAGEMTDEAFAKITGGILLIGAGISLLAGSWIPLLVAAIAGLVLVFWKYGDKIGKWLRDKAIEVGEFFDNIIQDIHDWYDDLYTDLWNKIGPLSIPIILVLSVFENVGTTIMGVFSDTVEFIMKELGNLSNFLHAFLTEDWEGVWWSLVDIVKDAVAYILQLVKWVLKAFEALTLQPAIKKVLELAGLDMSNVKSGSDYIDDLLSTDSFTKSYYEEYNGKKEAKNRAWKLAMETDAHFGGGYSFGDGTRKYITEEDIRNKTKLSGGGKSFGTSASFGLSLDSDAINKHLKELENLKNQYGGTFGTDSKPLSLAEKFAGYSFGDTSFGTELENFVSDYNEYQKDLLDEQRESNTKVNDLLEEQNTLLQQILEKTGISIDGKQIKTAYDRAVRESGIDIMSGGVVG